jgi:hypothetical protein
MVLACDPVSLTFYLNQRIEIRCYNINQACLPAGKLG